MSEKELMYIDDALAHLKQINDFCEEYTLELEDESFKDVVDKLIESNMSIYKKIYKLIETK